jgi:hypothetical protein
MRFEFVNGKCHDEAANYEGSNQQNRCHHYQGEKYLDHRCVIAGLRFRFHGLERRPAGRTAQFNGAIVGENFGDSGHS